MSFKEIPIEIYGTISMYIDINTFCNLLCTSKRFLYLDQEYFWENIYYRDYNGCELTIVGHKNLYIRMYKFFTPIYRYKDIPHPPGILYDFILKIVERNTSIKAITIPGLLYLANIFDYDYKYVNYILNYTSNVLNTQIISYSDLHICCKQEPDEIEALKSVPYNHLNEIDKMRLKIDTKRNILKSTIIPNIQFENNILKRGDDGNEKYIHEVLRKKIPLIRIDDYPVIEYHTYNVDEIEPEVTYLIHDRQFKYKYLILFFKFSQILEGEKRSLLKELKI